MSHSELTGLKFYGYLMDADWLYQWGLANGCAPTPPYPPPSEFDFESHTRTEACIELLDQAGFKWKEAGFRAFRVKGKMNTCLVLTTNEQNPRYKLLPQERYAKLKQILETEEDPKWWAVEYNP